jgi:DnaJ-class molecular chaperone
MDLCLRCKGQKIDPEFPGEECRVCHGSGEKQPDIVLQVQNIKTTFNVSDLLRGGLKFKIE